jgi:hypothetical protein
VKLRPDSALYSGPASGIDCEARRLSYVSGSHPEDETDHRTPLYPEALIGGRVSWTPGGAIRFRELELEGLMSFRYVVTVWIWGKQIDAHAPQF